MKDEPMTTNEIFMESVVSRVEPEIMTATDLKKKEEEYYNSNRWKEHCLTLEKLHKELVKKTCDKVLEIMKRDGLIK